MGSPVSHIVANLWLEDLEQRSIASALEDCKPKFWKKYVDNTLEIIKRGSAEKLTAHLNTVEPMGSLKFTHEEE